MSNISNMSLGMSLGKDDRKFLMEQEIVAGKTLTVSSCARSLGLSKNTIRTYLKEINYSIYDDETKEMTKAYKADTVVIYPF